MVSRAGSLASTYHNGRSRLARRSDYFSVRLSCTWADVSIRLRKLCSQWGSQLLSHNDYLVIYASVLLVWKQCLRSDTGGRALVWMTLCCQAYFVSTCMALLLLSGMIATILNAMKINVAALICGTVCSVRC